MRIKEMARRSMLSMEGPTCKSNLGWSPRRVKAKKWRKIWICSASDTNLLCDLGYLVLPLKNLVSSLTKGTEDS